MHHLTQTNNVSHSEPLVSLCNTLYTLIAKDVVPVTPSMDTNSGPMPSTSAPVSSTDKALRVLGALGDAGPAGLALSQLTQQTGLNKTSVYRAAQTLIHRGFAAQEPESSRYVLGPAAIALTGKFLGQEHLVTHIRPALLAISERTRELVHFGILQGTSVLYLDKIEPDRTLRVWSRVGNLAPAARTALGRAILAAENLDESVLDVYAEAAKPVTAPPNENPLDKEKFYAAVRNAPGLGFATEVEENERGICCVGVGLIRQQGSPVAVSVSGPAERMDPDRRAELAEIIREELQRNLPLGFRLAY